MRYLFFAAMLLFAAPVQAESCLSASDHVKVYFAEWCPYCRAEMKYLRAHNIPFKECDIETSETYASELRELIGDLGVPHTIIGNKQISGFDEDEFNQIFGPGSFE